MGSYLLGRAVYAIVAIFIISVVSFVLIQAPPGDYLTSQLTRLQASGRKLDDATVERMKEQYGLDKPIYVQYGRWIAQMFRGNFGQSFYYNYSVLRLLRDYMPMTIILALITLVFIYVLSIPIGIFTAVKQYSVFDYLFTVLGFIGLSVPNFVLALVVMFFFYKTFGISIGGLFSIEYADAAWGWAKFVDLVRHLWAPVIVVGIAGTAGIIRVIRAAMLDELGKEYMQVARAKGLSEFRLIMKYPVRVALNPILSTVGWQLPNIIGGFVIAGIVLNLPIIGPVLLNALTAQDMYLAGAIVLLLSVMTVLGTILSDITLAIADPRIRYY
jgi:peptide/nickel transport system permease protein